MRVSTRLLLATVSLGIIAALGGCDMLIPPDDPGPGPNPQPNALCSNSCPYARDGECDDGGPGAIYNLCAYGSDCADCGTRQSNPQPNPQPNVLCTNSCPYAQDGECDDGGPGAIYNLCAYGSDCADCGTRTPLQETPTGAERGARPRKPLGVSAKPSTPVSQAEWWKLSHGDGTPDLSTPTFIRGLLQGAGATC